MENSKETSWEIETVKKYIDEHFATTITIQYLAKLVFVSPTKLKKDFRTAHGSTLHDFLLHKRMKIATDLLLESETAISEIALHCGYKTHTAFTVAFKKHFKMLPKEYRMSGKLEKVHE